MAYSYSQLQQLWIQNGGSPSFAPIAAAVALAESGGNPNAVSKANYDGSVDRGLWQINSIHGAKSTLDVTGNTRAAIIISSNGTNWNPWTVYKTGAYKKYLNGATVPGSEDSGALAQAGLSVAGIQIPNPLDAITALSEGITSLVKGGTWFTDSHNIVRMVQVAMGGLLVIVGIIIVARGTIENVIEKVGPVAATAI